MNKLIKLLESLQRRRPIGTLVLGRRGRNCDLFVEEDRIYYASREYSGKVEIDGILAHRLRNSRITETQIEAAIASANLFQKTLAEVLTQQGLISPEDLDALLISQLREEIFARALHHGESFTFQEDQVPAHLLGDDPRKAPLLLQDVLELLRGREEALAAMNDLIPSRKEVFVVTEKGMAHQNTEGDFAERKIFALIDGFRDLSGIIRDVPFFEYHVMSRIAEALKEGHLKKTVLPEVRDVNIAGLNPQEAEALIPAFKSAVKYAIDEIGAHERLALLYERMGQNDEAVIQYNYIGDALYRMKKSQKALKAFQRAIELRSSNPMIVDKVIKIHQELAAQALLGGKRDEAITLLRSALEVRPEIQVIFDQLLVLHIEGKEVREVVELCDIAVARSRSERDIQAALRVLKLVKEKFPREALFQKKLINLYIDFGLDSEAIDELEELAQREIKLGQAARAQEILEKILRIDPGRDDVRRRLRRLERRALARRIPRQRISAIRLVLVVLLAASGYQVWSYFALKSIREESLAWGQGASPEAAGIARSPREKSLLQIAARADLFRDRFPFSAFTFEALRIAATHREEAARLEKARDRRKEEIFEEGMRVQGDGRPGAAVEVLERLLELDDDDPWRKKAREALAKIDAYEWGADEIRRRFESAQAKGDWNDAWKTARQLLEEYPLSSSAASMEVPVEVRTVPEGATLAVDGAPLGLAPRRVKVRPGRPAVITAEAKGCEKLREEVLDDGGPSKLLILNRRPAWTASPGGRLKFPPVLTRSLVLTVLEDGTLVARSRTDGSPRWSFPSGRILIPLAAPIEVEGRVFLALNDGQILGFSRDGTPDLRLKPEGLITTRLVPSYPGEFVFGSATGQVTGQVTGWSADRGTAAWTVQVRGVPAMVAAPGPGQVLLGTEKGRLMLLESPAGRIAWEVSIEEKLSASPVEVGGTVIAQTAERRLVAIDIRSGTILWRRVLSAPGAAAILPAKKRILTTGEAIRGRTQLIEIDPLTGKESSHQTLLFEVSSLVGLGRGAGAISRTGGFLFLDGENYAPRWGYRPAAGSVTSATEGAGLVVLTTDGGEILGFP